MLFRKRSSQKKIIKVWVKVMGRKIYEILADDMFRQKIAFLGDFHIGNPETDEGLIRSELDKAVKEGAKIVIMGDMIENASKYSIGAGVYEQTMHPQDQIDRIIELLKPYSSEIIGILKGNHESRAEKHMGIDPAKLIADRLGVPYFGYDAPMEIKVGDQKYYVYVAHGSGGASTKSGKMRTVEKWAKIYPDMDAYVSGHHHDRMIWEERVYRTKKGKLEEGTRYYVITGAYMEQPEYARVKAYPLGNKGGVIMEFWSTGDVVARPISD